MTGTQPAPVRQAGAERLWGLPPLVSATTRVLILGSFPGVASLQARQYYGHPQNQFWKILQAIWPAIPMDMGVDSYEKRSKWLLGRGLGLWDVYASCERSGSLDSAIRHAEVNDFAALKTLCPRLQLIVHNGSESFKHASRVRASLGLDPVLSVRLPSTSPAHARWRLAQKVDVWRAAFAQAGLV